MNDSNEVSPYYYIIDGCMDIKSFEVLQRRRLLVPCLPVAAEMRVCFPQLAHLGGKPPGGVVYIVPLTHEQSLGPGRTFNEDTSMANYSDTWEAWGMLLLILLGLTMFLPALGACGQGPKYRAHFTIPNMEIIYTSYLGTLDP